MQRLKIIFILLAAATSARCYIIYSSGPSFEIPAPPAVQSLELTRHGSPDFFFWGDTQTNYETTTPPQPLSGYVEWSYYIGTDESGAVTVSSEFGNWIGIPNPLPPQKWDVYGLLTDRSKCFGDVICFGPQWAPPLGFSGVGYIGIHFHARDGWHYGWIRARLPISTPAAVETAPVVVDWAYESQPDIPIQAGMIGSRGRSFQFALQFPNQPQSGPAPPVPGYGSFILTGQTLRYELRLILNLSSADICAVNHFHSQLITPLERPFTTTMIWFAASSYFGEVKLSHSQIAQLLRGDFVITDGNGTIIGRIVPMRRPR